MTQRPIEIDWKAVLGATLFFALVLGVGPLALLFAWLIQRWCAAGRFDAQDRWNAIFVFAWFFGILVGAFYGADIAFPALVAHVWFLSPLHVLGPPVFGNFVFLWSIGILFSPTLTFVLERGRPLTIRWYHRIPTEEEGKEIARRDAAQQAEKERQARQAEAARLKAAQTVYKPFQPAAGAPSSVPKQAQVAVETQDSDLLRYAKEQAATKEQERHQFLQEEAQRATRSTTPPQIAPPAPSSETSPAGHKKPKKEKIDLGDGSMDSLL